MVPFERSLVNKYKDRPFALVGVQCYDKLDKAKKFAKEKSLNWRSFFDEKGVIAQAWGVRGFPTVYFLDHEGVIRSVNVHGDEAITAEVEKLVKKAEAAAQSN